MKTALISHPECLLHEMGYSHPECPDRLKVIQDHLVKTGIIQKLKPYTAPLATREHLLRVHSEDYINSIYQSAPQEGLVFLDPDTAMNSYTLIAALKAAGAVIQAVDIVMKGEVNSAFCLVRPPGHHAERSQAMGFCFFNNIAVGVAHALEHYHLQRVAIIDFDVHHGNGTENIFQADERVLLCSSFQHPFYPFSGADTPPGHILNLPLPAGTHGKIYRSLVKKYWLDAIKQFNPELIFFSAGFDGHAEDEMAHLSLLEEDYAWLTEEIKMIAQKCCQGRMISALEGGYALEALARSVVAHIQAMVGR